MNLKDLYSKVKMNYLYFGKTKEIYACEGFIAYKNGEFNYEFFDEEDELIRYIPYTLTRDGDNYTSKSNTGKIMFDYDTDYMRFHVVYNLGYENIIDHVITFMPVDMQDNNSAMKITIKSCIRESSDGSVINETMMTTDHNIITDSSTIFYSILFIGTKCIPVVRLSSEPCDVTILHDMRDIYNSQDSKVTIYNSTITRSLPQNNVKLKSWEQKADELKQYIGDYSNNEVEKYIDTAGVTRIREQDGTVKCIYQDQEFFNSSIDNLPLEEITEGVEEEVEILEEISDMLNETDAEKFKFYVNTSTNRRVALYSDLVTNSRQSIQVEFYNGFVVILDLFETDNNRTYVRLLDHELGLEIFNLSYIEDHNNEIHMTDYSDHTGYLYKYYENGESKFYSDPLLTLKVDSLGNTDITSSLFSDPSDTYYRDRYGMLTKL